MVRNSARRNASFDLGSHLSCDQFVLIEGAAPIEVHRAKPGRYRATMHWPKGAEPQTQLLQANEGKLISLGIDTGPASLLVTPETPIHLYLPEGSNVRIARANHVRVHGLRASTLVAQAGPGQFVDLQAADVTGHRFDVEEGGIVRVEGQQLRTPGSWVLRDGKFVTPEPHAGEVSLINAMQSVFVGQTWEPVATGLAADLVASR